MAHRQERPFSLCLENNYDENSYAYKQDTLQVMFGETGSIGRRRR